MKLPKISQSCINNIYIFAIISLFILALYVYFYQLRRVEGLESLKKNSAWRINDDKGDMVFSHYGKPVFRFKKDGTADPPHIGEKGAKGERGKPASWDPDKSGAPPNKTGFDWGSIKNCGCDWTSSNTPEQAEQRFDENMTPNLYKKNYKWCFAPDDKNAREQCEGGTFGSHCRLNSKGHCVTRGEVPGESSWEVFTGRCRDNNGEHPAFTPFSSDLPNLQQTCLDNPKCQGFGFKSKDGIQSGILYGEGFDKPGKEGVIIKEGNVKAPEGDLYNCYINKKFGGTAKSV